MSASSSDIRPDRAAQRISSVELVVQPRLADILNRRLAEVLARRPELATVIESLGHGKES